MESLLYKTIEHVKKTNPQLSVVDENYGQLDSLCSDNPDNMYPLTFPAVLIDLQETLWTTLTPSQQRGEARINVQLIIDCYDDTHYGCGTMQAISQRAEMAERLHGSLQGFQPWGGERMRRESSKFYTARHGIKVYETVCVIRMSSTQSSNSEPA